MKRITIIIAALCAIWPPIQADAGCAVRCNRVVAVEQFVAVPAAIVTGVPVAAYGPTAYSYTPSQPVNVTVNLNADDIANRVVQKLNATDQQQTPPLPAPPPIPAEPPAPAQQPRSLSQAPVPPSTQSGAVGTNCLGCHSPGHNAAALARIDLTQPLTCEQRLACARAVLSTKMPRGKKLDADQAGAVLSELLGAK